MACKGLALNSKQLRSISRDGIQSIPVFRLLRQNMLLKKQNFKVIEHFWLLKGETMKNSKLKEIMATAIILTSLSSAFSNSNLSPNGLSQNIENGSILHVWCWSFNTMKKNMKEIAASGFSAIQTSPVSQCLVGENGGLEIFGSGKWYYHYQPTKYTIGNYQMGSEKEFIEMCNEAHKYGVKVIVDVVANHCTATWEAIDPKLRNIEGDGFHSQDGYWSETDRYEETQYALSGLWDLNTQNPKVQNHILEFLKRCVEDGADGFRYDAAKLIELPDDTTSHPEKYNGSVKTHPNNYKVQKFTSDFWPRILNNGSKFQYGEVLQEGGNISYSKDISSGYNDELSSRLAAYHKYMRTTNSMYGFRIREAAKTNNFDAAFISDNLLPKGANPEKVVTWVESHDNYCNDASYKIVNPSQVIRAWAVIASRKNGTPLFFDRPKGSTENNPWGQNVIGKEGSSIFKDKQVTEVNFFRNAMAGKEEYISNPTGKKEVVMIERGKEGSVIINSLDSIVELQDSPVKSMADGKYKDQVYGEIFEVKNGKITGRINAGSVAVLWNKDIKTEEFDSDIESSELSGYFLDETMKVTLRARNVEDFTYQINKESVKKAVNGTQLTLGENIPYGKSIKLTISGIGKDGKKITKKYVYKKCLYKKNTIIYFDPSVLSKKDFIPGEKVCAYVYNSDASKTNASWPGIELKKMDNGIYRYVLPYELESQTTYIIFNNGNGGKGNQFPAGAGVEMFSGTKMILQKDGSLVKYKE